MRVAILLGIVWGVLGTPETDAKREELMTCNSVGPGYFKFFSKTMDQLAPGESLTFEGHCFKDIAVKVTQEDDKLLALIEARGLKALGCAELVLVSTGKTTNVQVMLMPTTYIQEVPLGQLSPEEREYVEAEGLFIMRGCDDLRNFPKDVWMTIKLFIGGWFTSQWIPIFGSKIPEFQVRANMDFVKQATGFEWRLREDRKKVLLDPKYIHSGDFFGLTRFDGVANVAHVVTGSPVGHCAMALWDEGTLWVIETEDGGGNTRKGIKRTEYKEWIHHADLGDNSVVLVRLKKELRDKMNVPGMWAAYKLIQGIPYGFNNFIFGSQDTLDQNRPDYFDPNFVVTFAGVLFKWFPSLINRVLVNGLNMRLGTKGLDVDGIWQEIYEQRVTVPELLAIVEDEDWLYPEGISLVCSSLLVYLYKAGGLFGDLTINSPEFTPMDVLVLDFWDLDDQQLIDACKGRAPRGYCQIMGIFDMDLGRIGYVTPYNNMNERCSTMPPHYYRSDDC
jgi:hypothetical protein